jgi:hypothetical protein
MQVDLRIPATAPAKAALPGRAAFFSSVRKTLAGRGANADKLLRGLE